MCVHSWHGLHWRVVKHFYPKIRICMDAVCVEAKYTHQRDLYGCIKSSIPQGARRESRPYIFIYSFCFVIYLT